VSRIRAGGVLVLLLWTSCRRTTPEDPAERAYRAAVQLFAQSSAASQDLTYRDARFDAVLVALEAVPAGSELRAQADGLAKRIRSARSEADAAEAKSREEVERALAQPPFGPRNATPTASGARALGHGITPPSPGANEAPPTAPLHEATAAQKARRRSLPAGDQEISEGAAPAQEADAEAATQPEESAQPRAPGRKTMPASKPADGTVFGLPGPAGRAMSGRP
jgi:hypothetical protein